VFSGQQPNIWDNNRSARWFGVFSFTRSTGIFILLFSLWIGTSFLLSPGVPWWFCYCCFLAPIPYYPLDPLHPDHPLKPRSLLSTSLSARWTSILVDIPPRRIFLPPGRKRCIFRLTRCFIHALFHVQITLLSDPVMVAPFYFSLLPSPIQPIVFNVSAIDHLIDVETTHYSFSLPCMIMVVPYTKKCFLQCQLYFEKYSATW